MSQCEAAQFIQFSYVHRHDDGGLVRLLVVAVEPTTLGEAEAPVEAAGDLVRRPDPEPQQGDAFPPAEVHDPPHQCLSHSPSN